MRSDRDWAAIEARFQGITPKELLERIVTESGNKCEVIGLNMGMTAQAALALLKKYGVERKNAWDFEYGGVSDSMRGHCRRLGLNATRVYNYKYQHQLSNVQALDRYANNLVPDTRFGAAK